jgi:hypothetical protein
MRSLPLLFLTFLLLSCGTTPDGLPVGKNNFMITFSSHVPSGPAEDDLCYYRVRINKTERGRTPTGLESQLKTFSASLERNRHLVEFEKWVLDRSKKRYVRPNNIEQPRPDHVYVDLIENRSVRVDVRVTENHEAKIDVRYR